MFEIKIAMALNTHLFAIVILMAVLLSIVDCTIKLSGEMNENFYMGAVVIFNATIIPGNENEILGSPNQNNGRYGATSPLNNVSGAVVLATSEDGNYLGCQQNSYIGHNVRGPWVALAERGICTFAQKIQMAREANASAIIIYNYIDDEEINMIHKGEDKIVAVSISRADGLTARNWLLEGYSVSVDIRNGDYYQRLFNDGRTSVIFVALSFLILLIISMTWLIVYYVQRFRIIRPTNIDINKHRRKVKKVVNALPKKLLKEGDEEIVTEDICSICIESYKADDIIRKLPCEHVFHRKCVDSWLCNKETCPLCKYDIMKSVNALPSSHSTSVPTVEEWEPDPVFHDALSSSSIDALVLSTQEPSIVSVITNDEESKTDGTVNSNVIDFQSSNTSTPGTPGDSRMPPC